MAVRYLAALTLCAAPLTAQDSRSVEIDHLEERLQYLAEDLESQLGSLNIPGMAVAVVHEDELIFARGFGVADMQSGRKVTPETTFAIGSTSKAFTSILIGMLVDQAQMDWDAPITEYLPYFEMQLDTNQEDAQLTIRDLLCHRSGFTRMGLLWAAGNTTREESLRTATQAKSWDGFRKNFHYNNVMYLAAGEAVGKVAGMGWDAMLKERIFEPLGMGHSNSTYAQAQADKSMALGYSWQADLKEYKREQMRNIDSIAPAGSINSNVLDMSKWIRLQLGRGEFEGQTLISEAALTDTWEANIRVGGEISYGMGWMVNKYGNQLALHHGGNIDGFAAAVALLPESKLGYVLLTNISSTPLQAPTSTLVWDALLKPFEAKQPKQAAIEGEFDDLVGVFMGNFASFKDAEFTVSTKAGLLFVDIPGQLNYELLPPDAEDKRAIKMAPTAMFRFVREEGGQVNRMELHQGGATFELLRQGLEAELDLPLDEFEVFFGKYKDPKLSTPIEVKLQNGHLAIDVPGQMVFEMNVPNDEGLWMFRAVPGIAIEFEFDDEGQVAALIRHQGGIQERCERLADKGQGAGQAKLPSLAEIDELRHLKPHMAAVSKNGIVRSKGSVDFVHSGVKGQVEEVTNPDGRFYRHLSMGKFGVSTSGFDGTTGWVDSSFDEYEEPKGVLLDQMKLESNSIFYGDWRTNFDRVHIVRSIEIEGQKHWVIELTKGSLPVITLFLNQVSGDITRVDTTILSSSGVQISSSTFMRDYREVAGLRIPFEMSTKNDSAGLTVFRYESIDCNAVVDDELFAPRR